MADQSKNFTVDEAVKFFSDLFNGYHHLPSAVITFGNGFLIKAKDSLSTYDGNLLTRFVLKCHDECVRGEVRAKQAGVLKIIIWKRQGREGKMWDRHPTIETAIQEYNS